jgi:negative modulator of initiation of replication
MKTIEIEDDLYKYILANIEDFGETPSQILRRLLALPAVVNSDEKSINNQYAPPVISKTTEQKTISVVDEKEMFSSNSPIPEQSVPEPFAQGVEALFADKKFKDEPIVTNKFMMMLTTMYHENKQAFISAAKKTRGRTRDYLGENLSVLLASDNKEEVAQLKASKPRNIPNTPYWVITNANTGRKRIILTQMMAAMGYPHHLIERIKSEI